MTFDTQPGRKEPVLAIVLSIFLPGVGHFYVGDTGGLAIALFILTVLEFVMAFTILLLPISFLLWLPCAIAGSIDANRKAKERNARLGYGYT